MAHPRSTQRSSPWLSFRGWPPDPRPPGSLDGTEGKLWFDGANCPGDGGFGPQLWPLSCSPASPLTFPWDTVPPASWVGVGGERLGRNLSCEAKGHFPLSLLPLQPLGLPLPSLWPHLLLLSWPCPSLSLWPGRRDLQGRRGVPSPCPAPPMNRPPLLSPNPAFGATAPASEPKMIVLR